MTDQRTGGRTEAYADRGLRGAVLGYHGYPQLTVGALAPSAADEPVVSVILTFGDAAAGSPQADIEVVAAPTDSAARDALLARGRRGLHVDMTPMGASRLIGVAADRIGAEGLDHAAVLGADLPRLIRRLASAPTWAIRFAAVDEFLLKRLEQAPRRSLLAGAAWRSFAETHGMLLIGELAPVTEAADDTEPAPSPGDAYDVHTAASDRMRRRYHHISTQAAG